MNAKSGKWESFELLCIDNQHNVETEEMSQRCADYEKNVSRLLEVGRHEGIDVVHLRARFQQDESDCMVKSKYLGRIPCVAGTPVVEIFPFAQDEPGEFVIYKQSFDGFLKPALPAYLEKNRKRFLLLAGLATSVCVFLTAATAAQRGYLVGIVEDCCADSPEAHNHTLQRYPFIFDRTSVDQLTAAHGKWLVDLARLTK